MITNDEKQDQKQSMCDAEYCDDPQGCKKRHYHTSNCRCADCCAEFDDA